MYDFLYRPVEESPFMTDQQMLLATWQDATPATTQLLGRDGLWVRPKKQCRPHKKSCCQGDAHPPTTRIVAAGTVLRVLVKTQP